MVKLRVSNSTTPNVANLINESNIKKLRNNQRTEPPKCNCPNKTNCSLKVKCQFECIAYKAKLLSRVFNENKVSRKVRME